MKTLPVTVKVLEIEWLSDDKNLTKFYNFMAEIEGTDVFANELIKTLLLQNDYTLNIVICAFLPFLFYFGVSIVYLSHFVPTIKVDSFWGVPDDG
jgi:hypothetical protein